jgi:hypothetical protein
MLTSMWNEFGRQTWQLLLQDGIHSAGTDWLRLNKDLADGSACLQQIQHAAPELVVPMSQPSAEGRNSAQADVAAVDTGSLLSALAEKAEAAVGQLAQARQMQLELQAERGKVHDLSLMLSDARC